MAARKEVEFVITARDRTRAAFRRVGRGVRRLGASLAAAAALGAGLFAAAARSTLEFATNVEALSKRLLISGRTVQALEVIGADYGLTIEQIALVMQRLGTNAGEAADDNERMAEAFKKLGLTVPTIERLSRTELFLGLADGVKNFEGSAEELQATLKRIIDSEGVRLLPLLAEGAEGITAQIVALEKRNALISDPKIAQAAENEAEIRRELLILQRDLNKAMLPMIALLTEFLAQGEAESALPGGFARTAAAVAAGSVRNLGVVGETISAGVFDAQTNILKLIAVNTAETSRKVEQSGSFTLE